MNVVYKYINIYIMENKNLKNIIILVVVAIIFGVIGYLIPHHLVKHYKGKHIKNTIVSTSKSKHSILTQTEGNVSNINNNVLTINGENIIVEKDTEIYSGNSIETISNISDNSTISVIGRKTKKGIVAKFIIIL